MRWAAMRPLWFQLYWQTGPEGSRASGRAATLALVQRAAAAGYQALVLTVDAPLSGVRDRERRAAFALPAGVSINQPGARSCRRLAHLAGTRRPGPSSNGSARTRLPVLVRACFTLKMRAGAALRRAAWLSATMVGACSMACPPRRCNCRVCVTPCSTRLGPDTPCLLVDGGIRRGTDVLKALALGADAVMLGRPQVCALAAHGPHGVARCLALLHDEFIAAMALLRCAVG